VVGSVGFGALTAVVMHATILWDISSCSPYILTDISEERITSIFRIENEPRKKPALLPCLYVHNIHNLYES
jgi:hypothetical protein